MANNDRQRRIMTFIQDFVAAHGFPPSIREIGDEVGISSTSVVNYHLNKLTDKGYLERQGKVSRGLKLGEAITSLRPARSVPLLGTIQAGQPIPVLDPRTRDDTGEWVELTRQIVPGALTNLFALRVQGNSMIDAMINDGDIVVMEQAQTARNGEMVAALIKDREETTLKRFFVEEDGTIRLQPANPTMAPILIDDPHNVVIQGKVVAVIRSMAA
jgi:repressor LexA